jgi:transketolase
MANKSRKKMELKEIAKKIRKKTFLMCNNAGSGHIAPSFSSVDILVALYFKILRLNADNLNHYARNIFILSKGHASAALYAILEEKGILKKGILETFCQKGSTLGAHPEAHLIPGIELSTGSLGHGLSFGTGIALADKIDKKNRKVIVLLSDGECQEGSTWEGAMFASHHKLDSLVAIIDYNKLQSLGKTDDILSLKPFKDKWESFGWSVKEIDGHNIEQIVDTLNYLPFKKNTPNVVIAHTIKGKGIKFMENAPLWHYRIPSTTEERKIICKELGIDLSEFKK